MHWWKGGQHSCGNSNQVCPVWYLPPWWQKWLQGKDYGSQISLRCWTNQHRNPPGMADRKRQAARDLGHSYRGLTWYWTLYPRWWYQDQQVSFWAVKWMHGNIPFVHTIMCIVSVLCTLPTHFSVICVCKSLKLYKTPYVCEFSFHFLSWSVIWTIH